MKKSVIAGLGMLLGAGVGAAAVGTVSNKMVGEKEEKVNKFKSYYNVLNQWLALIHEGKTLDQYFEVNNYKTVAIYGMGELGNRLYEELKDASVQVKYAIDKNADSTFSDLDVKSLDDELEDVDVVVVTAVFAFDDVVDEISEKVTCPVISLEDVVYEM